MATSGYVPVYSEEGRQSEGEDDKSETSDESDRQSEMTDVEEEIVQGDNQVWKAIQVLQHSNYQGFEKHTNSCDINIIS